MNTSRTLTALAAALLLSGCASMSADECANSDWRAIGYEDGARGFGTERFGNRRKACAKHGVTANFDAYTEGRTAGLIEYCQPSRGFSVGEGGGRYNGVCNADQEPAFLEAYRLGKELHRLRSAVSYAASSLNGAENRLDSLKAEVDEVEAALIARDTAAEDRVLMLARLKELSEEKGQLESEIDTLIAELAIAETELGNYRDSLMQYGY